MSMRPANDAATPQEQVLVWAAAYRNPAGNLSTLLCDRHPPAATAFTIVDQNLTAIQLSFGELREKSERFAAALTELGVRPGDRVATLMGKSADYVIALLGIWRLGAVHVPLFTAFAPAAIALRLQASDARAVICDETQQDKLAVSEDMPAGSPWHVIVARRKAHTALRDAATWDFGQLLTRHAPGFPAAAVGGDGAMVHIYTSGTTGRPKGVVVPVWALAAFHAYLTYGLDVRPDDVYWCAADPGWAYGLYYGILGPLCTGVHGIQLNAGFSPDLTYRVLSDFQVTNFAAAPTVYRALRAAGDASARPRLTLRRASSAGEPLTPEVNAWANEALGVSVHDHYGQTETGMLVNNHHHPELARELKPGSMGQPMPGWAVHVLHADRNEVAPANTAGRIAVDTKASALNWFTGYDGDPGISAQRFSVDGRWYLTGDTGHRDDDGYFHFSARDDDVIITAGYRIGPFDVESVLASHPDVAECAVIAAPDSVRGEVLEAYVVPTAVSRATDELTSQLQDMVRTKLAKHAYPRAVHFVDQLPKTPSGKIQRFVLRQRRREGTHANPQ